MPNPFGSMVELEMDVDAMMLGSDFGDNETVASSDAPAPKLGPSPPPKPPKPTDAKRRCRLCVKWQPEDNFPVNCAYCRNCKQAVDNLAKQAARQNETEYWKGVRQDETKLKSLVAHYLSQCPKSGDKNKRGAFNIASCREVFSATTSSGVKARGRMMWEGYFVEFAQKPKGGSHTEEEARKKWKEMLEDPSVEKDELGPAKASRRCCVPMFDEVAHGSKLTHGKEQILQKNKDSKNVTVEQAGKDRRLLLQGHERGALSKNGEHLDFGGAVSGMLSSNACGTGGTKLSASGSGFAGQGAFIPDISALRRDMEEEEMEAAELADEKNKDSGDAGGEAPTETEKGSKGTKRTAGSEALLPPPKKTRWFDSEAARDLEILLAELLCGSGVCFSLFCFFCVTKGSALAYIPIFVHPARL